MRCLIACEFSGVVRDAFAAKGWDAWSCDLEETERVGNHIVDDVRNVLYSEKWDLVIAHPPCTYLTTTGNRWFGDKYKDKYPTRYQDREDALQFFIDLYNAPCERVCIENPIGITSTRFRKPDQIIEPYQFGHPTTKRTGLWLRGLPNLTPTQVVDVEWHYFKSGKRWSQWYYETGNERTPALKAKARNRTFEGVAHAMADQWTEFCEGAA